MTRPRESRAEQALGQGLEAARIQELPEAAYYISNFLTPEEEERLLQKVCTWRGPLRALFLARENNTSIHTIHASIYIILCLPQPQDYIYIP